jgi:hypothetical protein
VERTASIIRAREIMGTNFIGPAELSAFANKIGILDPFRITTPIPDIPFDSCFLKTVANEYLLILGTPLTIKNEPLTLEKMRSFFGFDPLISEPCFYNQDWYLKEDFITKETLDLNWYLLKKEVQEDSRGLLPFEFLKNQREEIRLPSAIVCAFTFFAWYFHSNGEILWKHDYVWCKDTDFQGDQIYIGRYLDPAGLNKNGFSIHRHLQIKNSYGVISEFRP